jgi:hypothetical protein
MSDKIFGRLFAFTGDHSADGFPGLLTVLAFKYIGDSNDGTSALLVPPMRPQQIGVHVGYELNTSFLPRSDRIKSDPLVRKTSF